LSACSEARPAPRRAPPGDPMAAKKSDFDSPRPPPQKMPQPTYPWDERPQGKLPRITKEYFRCKGSMLNPEYIKEQNGKPVRIADCGGADRHSLPLKGDSEAISPILIHLLNYLQNETSKKAVITSGHRCPEHNTYVDSSRENQTSKHLMGAEVSFYLQGMESRPQEVVDHIMEYYQK